MKTLRRFILKLVRRRRLEADLEAEMAFHREMAAHNAQRHGGGQGAIPFGNTGVIKEQALDLWRFNFAENLWRDTRYALRALRQSPGFVLAALLSLALGIGVNTTMFSLTMEFLFSEPSVRDASRIVYVRQGGNSHVEAPAIAQFRRSGLFEDVAGENAETYINYNDGIDTRRVFATQATENYFTMLGIPVALGRGWNESDSKDVVVLHPRFWRTRFAGDPNVIGRAIRLDGRLYTVLGVLPDGYRSLIGYGFSPDVYVPQYIDGTILAAYARLKPGMSLGQLTAALPAAGAQLDREFPSKFNLHRDLSATPVSGLPRLQKEKGALTVALFFAALLIVVGLVLLIACVNVAGLMLARSSARQQEISIRLALGASRGRLLQQLLAESLLLSLAGAALGFALALVAAKAVATIPLPAPVPLRLEIEPDWRVLTYAALLAIFSTLASGLMPAWQALRESLTSGMHRERKLRLRRALVIAQIAVSFIVLTTAALFLHNLLRSSSLGPGFDVHNSTRAEVHLPPAAYKDRAAVLAFVDRALEELRAIPGAEAVAAARILPFVDSTRMGLEAEFPATGQKQHIHFHWNAVSDAYFQAMGIPFLQGGTFGPAASSSGRSVIVNEEFVKRYLPQGPSTPVGVEFLWTEDRVPYRIVGVVRATRNMTIGEDPIPQVFEPLSQVRVQRTKLQFVVRSTVVPPAQQLTPVREALRRVEPSSGLEVETMFGAIGFAFLPSRVGALLMGSIGALGLLLVVIGLYGVLAYSVARRTREIGIRIAIGASGRDVSRIVYRELSWLLGTGVAIGLAATVLVTRPLAVFFVPGLSPSDPATFGIVAGTLLVTGTLAAAGPVRRALRVDPLKSLRLD